MSTFRTHDFLAQLARCLAWDGSSAIPVDDLRQLGQVPINNCRNTLQHSAVLFRTWVVYQQLHGSRKVKPSKQFVLLIVPIIMLEPLQWLFVTAIFLRTCTKCTISARGWEVTGVFINMWQSCVEIEGYSVTYFNHNATFEMPYCWTSVQGSCVLHIFIGYSCIYELCMSPTLKRSSVVRHFEHINGIKIRYGIIFDLYTGLPHIYSPLHSCFHSNRWVLFSMYWQEVVDSVSYTTRSCKMMFLISAVYNVNYHVWLLLTTKTDQVGEYTGLPGRLRNRLQSSKPLMHP